MIKPELLAPAGDLEKLKVAVTYGADAVYIGGQDFSLRAKSKNFDLEEMAEGIRFAHGFGKPVYITANIFAHNEDIDRIPAFFEQVKAIGADALIVSDPGVFALARNTGLDIHISTQANTTNYASAGFWHNMGAKRVVLARELSFDEIERIRGELPKTLELEAFVHGAMCVSYSGRCLLSSYLSSRNSNAGACSQPCRWKYSVSEASRQGEYFDIDEDTRGTYIFNSKDLCMVGYIPELIKAGVTSFKIEGRMKTPYYVACTVKAYRRAIDDYFRDPKLYSRRIPEYTAETAKASHREFSTGFYKNSPTQVFSNSSYIREYDFVGMVLGYEADTGFAVVEQRNKFLVGSRVEVLRALEDNYDQIIEIITDMEGNLLSEAPHPQQILRVKLREPVKKFDMLRVRRADIESS